MAVLGGVYFLMDEVPLYRSRAGRVQGYLAHQEQPFSLGPPYGPGWSYCRVLGGGCFY